MKSAFGRILPAIFVLVLAGLLGYFVFTTNAPKNPFAIKLGLDLAGGTELIYKADTSTVQGNKQESLSALRDVIDRRVNLFGVAEPLVQLEKGSSVAGSGEEDRLLVELPGVTDVKAAVDAIGKTPTLEFKLVGDAPAPTLGTTTASSTGLTLIPTGLTGGYLKSAEVQFGSNASGAATSPTVLVHFNDAGAALFEKITKENVGKRLAIILDGNPISTPVINEAIPGGSAVISGNFTPIQARDLVRNLNYGALPVGIKLISSDTVGPTLGDIAFHAGLLASMVGFLLVALFMIIWYRLPGVIAAIALVIYVLITVALIKAVPITLTASGIAGLILSIGLAVDANVLIFERMKEEVRLGKNLHEAARIGFGRAWPAIRDGHLTMIISAVILFWLGTSLVKGFALVFGFGVIASLITAVFITRIFLLAVLPEEGGKVWKFLVSSGFSLKK